MYISSLFVLSVRGDTVIYRDFRHDVPKSATEVFFRRAKFWDEGEDGDGGGGVGGMGTDSLVAGKRWGLGEGAAAREAGVLGRRGTGSAPPIFCVGGVHFFHVRRGGLYVVATTVHNVPPSLVLELLSRTCVTVKDYCGVLSEESLRKNLVLVYELLDEIIDGGYGQVTKTDALKQFVFNEPVAVESVAAARDASPAGGMLAAANKRISASVVAKPIASLGTMASMTASSMLGAMGGGGSASAGMAAAGDGGRLGGGAGASVAGASGASGGSGKRRNEIFVDIMENVSMLFDASGRCLTAEVDGLIQCKSYLSGNPDIRIALNEDLAIGTRESSPTGYGSVLVDDANFHEAVRLGPEFDDERVLSLSPPEGEFQVMQYRVARGDVVPPFRVACSVEEVGRDRVHVTVRLQAEFPAKVQASNLRVTFPVPWGTQRVSFEPSKHPAAQGQSCEYLEAGSAAGGDGGDGDGESGPHCVWRVKRLSAGQTELVLVAKVFLDPATANPGMAAREVGPVNLAFEVPMYSCTWLQVRFLQFLNRPKGYNPYRWVRYVTYSNSYVTRVGRS